MKIINTVGACAVAYGALTGCSTDETLFAKGAGTRVWGLESLNGAEPRGHITLMFAARGKFSGHTPCHDFSGRQTAPYPWFAIQDVSATASRCDLEMADSPFVSVLLRMNVSEVSGNLMILSNEVGEELVFSAMPAVDG